MGISVDKSDCFLNKAFRNSELNCRQKTVIQIGNNNNAKLQKLGSKYTEIQTLMQWGLEMLVVLAWHFKIVHSTSEPKERKKNPRNKTYHLYPLFFQQSGKRINLRYSYFHCKNITSICLALTNQAFVSYQNTGVYPPKWTNPRLNLIITYFPNLLSSIIKREAKLFKPVKLSLRLLRWLTAPSRRRSVIGARDTTVISGHTFLYPSH